MGGINSRNLRALDLSREIVADTLEDGNMYTYD
jgi:hypothetical protein